MDFWSIMQRLSKGMFEPDVFSGTIGSSARCVFLVLFAGMP